MQLSKSPVVIASDCPLLFNKVLDLLQLSNTQSSLNIGQAVVVTNLVMQVLKGIILGLGGEREKL